MSLLIETPRLSLRPFATTDQANLFLLYGDPDVMAIRKIGTQTQEGSGTQLQIILEHWGRKGFGLWAVYDRETDEFMGECGLRELRNGSDEIELSYGLIPSFWGSGFASEAAIAVIEFGFTHLELDKIYGMADGSNESSLRVLKKLGFEIESVMKDGAGAVVRTVLSEDRWRFLHFQKAQS